MAKSVEIYDFLLIILRKAHEKSIFPLIVLWEGMPLYRIICRKAKLAANYPAESFRIPRKVRTHFLEAFH
jgi:hypothetical protein